MAARRINLLPAELEKARRERQRILALALAGVGIIVIFIALYLFAALKLSTERKNLTAAQERVNTLRAEAAQLSEFEDLNNEVQLKTRLVNTLTQDEVRWSVLLADTSLVIPADAWLTSFAGTVTGADPATPGASAGSITMNGITFTHLDVAKWLSRLEEVDEFTFPYLSLSSKALIGTTAVVNFNSTVQLSEKAFRSSQPGARRVL